MYYKKHLSRILPLLLCLLCFVSCHQTTPSGEDSSDSVQANTDGTVIYTLIRTDSDNAESREAAKFLSDALEELYGCEIEMETDWVKYNENVEDHRFTNEILIGKTNRAESAAGIDALKLGTRDRNDFVLSSNDSHYVISAAEGCLTDAVNAFLAHVKADPTMLYAPPTEPLSEIRKHQFPLQELMFADVPVSEYDAIVCPASYDSRMIADITVLADCIYEACGTTLPVLQENDPNLPSGKVIRVGARADDALFSAGIYSYSVTISDTGVAIDGRDVFGDLRGVDYLTAKITDGYDAGGTLALTAADGIRYETSTQRQLMRTAWTYAAPMMTEEWQFAEIKDCGFNLVIISPPSENALLYNYCKWMAKYDLQALWYDSNMDVTSPEDVNKDTLLTPDANGYLYLNTDVTWGHDLKDEPNANLFSGLAKAIREYSALTTREQIAYINLHPIIATAEQLGIATYQKYLTAFFETVQPNYASVDIYPLRSDGSVFNMYFKNLDIFATECRTREIPFGVYIQAMSYGDHVRTPNEREMRWQAWCCLSFGAENIQYFTYLTPGKEEDGWKDALITRSGEKTEGWYGAQAVNRELAAISDVFMQYKNLGAFTVNEGKYSYDAYMKFENQYTDFDAVESITVSDDSSVLIGAFSSDTAEHSRAFTCVKLGDPGKETDPITVTVKLTTATNAVLYYRGESTTLTPDENGCIIFTLETGDGCFVTVGEEET